MARPLCFVLMPFGLKKDPTGRSISFDAVYEDLIKPAIEDASMEPIRADEEQAGGIIHKPMFERLILCEFAVADLTTANPNVFYELGVRHAARPRSTVLLFAGDSRLPFDVSFLRAIPYGLDADGKPTDTANTRAAITKALEKAREGDKDSPVFRLVEDYPGEIHHEKTDVFRKQVELSRKIRDKLEEARRKGAEAVRDVETSDLTPIADQETGVVVDLFLSYRAVKAWKEMIRLAGEMSRPLAATVMIREQLALALNRDGQGEKAERELLDLMSERGPSSETYGILGRVYKDRWEAARKEGSLAESALLKQAVDAYLKGFEADWRDAYPGINAATLMELAGDERRHRLIPVVTYSVDRKIESGEPDYWDYATRLELAMLASDRDAAAAALSESLARVREAWEPETTARNLRLINEARKGRGELEEWMTQVVAELDKRAAASGKA